MEKNEFGCECGSRRCRTRLAVSKSTSERKLIFRVEYSVGGDGTNLSLVLTKNNLGRLIEILQSFQ